MEGVVSDVDQRYDMPAGAVSVTLPPEQNVVGPLAVTVATGSGLTVTAVAGEVTKHPLPSVIVIA